MFDTSEFDKIIEKLEQLKDEVLAAQLLQKFSKQQSKVSKLLLNRDEQLSNEEWKELCDKENLILSNIIKEIDEVVENE